MSAAQSQTRETPFEQEALFDDEAAPEAPFALREPVLKQQVAERLAAHRAKRGQARQESDRTAAPRPSPARARSARIAATVAERYAQSPSYRAVLAAEAERAIREAEAAAEVAAISARAVVDAQMKLLDELDEAIAYQPVPQPHIVPAAPHAITSQSSASAATQAVINPAAFTVRLYEDVAPSTPPIVSSRVLPQNPLDEAESFELDQEIAFRQSPVFAEGAGTTAIPANLLEFPRHLVAARKARPRLAEGPLRDEAPETGGSQLRIFEVEADQISSAPAPMAAEPEWSSILLSAQPVAPAPEATAGLFGTPIYSAPLSLRFMAGIMDLCIVTSGFLAATTAFAYIVPRLPTFLTGGHTSITLSLPTAALAAAGTLFLLGLVYQLLFFTFSDATPGMRFARIGLCTFSDDNPPRSAMRRRILATLLAACPLGIGFLWAALDDDGLGWHDRITHMYQRAY